MLLVSELFTFTSTVDRDGCPNARFAQGIGTGQFQSKKNPWGVHGHDRLCLELLLLLAKAKHPRDYFVCSSSWFKLGSGCPDYHSIYLRTYSGRVLPTELQMILLHGKAISLENRRNGLVYLHLIIVCADLCRANISLSKIKNICWFWAVNTTGTSSLTIP